MVAEGRPARNAQVQAARGWLKPPGSLAPMKASMKPLALTRRPGLSDESRGCLYLRSRALTAMRVR